MRLTNLKNLHKTKNSRKRRKKDCLLKTQSHSLKENKKFSNGFKSKIFPIGTHTQGKRHPLDLTRVANVFGCTQIKILTPKQILQRLHISLAQVKVGNAFEKVLNPNKAGDFDGSFFWGVVQFDPHFIFQEELI